MATYRRQLKDENGNNIVPVMSGDQTEWIQTGDIADEAVTADKIDFTTSWPLGEVTFSLSDGGNSNYSDGSVTTDWYGYNFSNSGTARGEAETYSGTYSRLGIGGGLKLKATLTPGTYLVTADIAAYAEGSYDGYRPYRILVNSTAITGDIGISQRGGGSSTMRIVHLDPGDTITVQLYRWSSGHICNTRWWFTGYLIRPD